MSTDGQGTLWRRNIAENFNRLSRAHERYRQQTTDGWTMTYSEHELEFTFAKNRKCVVVNSNVVGCQLVLVDGYRVKALVASDRAVPESLRPRLRRCTRTV